MSYDLILYRPVGPVSDFAKLMDEDDFEPPPMGSPGDVMAAIKRGFPNTDWSNDGWGHFDGRGYRIDFHVGEESPVRSLMLNLYGDHAFLKDVAALCRNQGWQAHDPQTGKFLDLSNPSAEGVERFERFLEQVAEGGTDDATLSSGESDRPHRNENEVIADVSPIAGLFRPSLHGEPTDEQRQQVLALLDRLMSGADAEILAAYAPDAKISVAVARETETEHELTITLVDLNMYLRALPNALAQARAAGGPGFRFWLEDVQLGTEGGAVRVFCRVCSTLDANGCFTEYRFGPDADGRWRVLEQRTHRV